ncbi:MAG: helix-turn-helix transcriptional regulator [Lachnospiraceae bacterium]
MLDRRLGIIYLLMKKKTVSAAELAERYEVSVRTIYRDVEALSMAGIPVYARKGKNGGISLTEQFVLNKLLVTEEEQQQILSALQSLQEVGAQAERNTLQKLGDFFKVEPKNWVAVDFSDWSGRRQQLFEDIRSAILGNRLMTFDYYGQYGEMSRRTVEPIQLLFKEYTWYLRAFCRDRQAMRLFKVLRMKRVTVLSEKFDAVREITGNEKRGDTYGGEKCDAVSGREKHDETSVTFRIDKSEAYRVYDRFDEEEIILQPDGSFLIKITCPLDEWVYGLILSFGPAAEVISPGFVREEITRRLEKMLEAYF